MVYVQGGAGGGGGLGWFGEGCLETHILNLSLCTSLLAHFSVLMNQYWLLFSNNGAVYSATILAILSGFGV